MRLPEDEVDCFGLFDFDICQIHGDLHGNILPLVI